MKKFLHVLISVAIGLIPLVITIVIVANYGIDLGAVNDHPEHSGFPAGLFLIFGGVGWGVCTAFVYAFKDFDSFDVSDLEHPVLFRILWSFMATLAIACGFAVYGANPSAYTATDAGFLNYLGIAFPLGIAGFIFTAFLARAFFFDSFFKKFLLPLAVMGGLFVIAIPLYFIGKVSNGETREVLWVIIPAIGVLTLPVMGIISLKDIIGGGSGSGSSSSSGYGGGKTSGANPRDALYGLNASYTLGCTVRLTIDGVQVNGDAVYLSISKDVQHAWHENENEEKAERLAAQRLLDEANRRLKRINSDYYIAGVH